MDRVAELLDGWRTLAGWHRDWTTGPGPRKANALVDRLNLIAEAAVADPADAARIREIADHDEDPSVRRDARYWIHPWVPRPTDPEGALERWLRHPLVGLGDVEVAAEPAIMLLPNPAMPSLTWFDEREAQLELNECPASTGAWDLLETVHSNWGMDETYGPVLPLPTILGAGRDGDRRRILRTPGDPPVEFWMSEDELRAL